MSASRSGVMIITGGSRGIGAATAELAATRGYDVCIGYRRDEQAANDVVAACERSGRRAVAVAGDVSDEADVIELFAVSETALGPVTSVVNNAGILHQQARLDSFSLERLQEVMAVNVVGAFLVAREAVRRMSTVFGGAGGALVNVSSAASYLGSPGEYVDYAASKGALDTMTIGLAQEVAAEGVRVNAVRPGLIDTEIHASGGEADRVRRLASAVPMKRGGGADEVAEVILWLLSAQASYVTGTLVNVSGGR